MSLFEGDPSPVRVACITMGNQNQVIKPEDNMSVFVRLQIKPDMFPPSLRRSFRLCHWTAFDNPVEQLVIIDKNAQMPRTPRIGADVQREDWVLSQLN